MRYDSDFSTPTTRRFHGRRRPTHHHILHYILVLSRLTVNMTINSRSFRRSWIAICIILMVLATFQFRLLLSDTAIDLFDDLPISPRYKAEKYDFVPTKTEAACFDGTLANQTYKDPIPNIVHYVIGLHDAEISYPAYLSIKSALKSLKPEALKLHHTGNIDIEHPYIQYLLKHPAVKLVLHNPEQLVVSMSGSNHYAHLADILRLQVLQRDGGIYLDSDVFALKAFATLRQSPRDVVLGNEGGNRNGLCNAVIIARPGAAFLQRWIDSYKDFREGEWNDHSVLLPKKWADANPSEVCQLSPHAFFWPTWTRKHVRWMHEPLTEDGIKETRQLLRKNGGTLYDGQLAYHAWNQMSWGAHLSKLNDSVVLKENTRFNMMVRRFVG